MLDIKNTKLLSFYDLSETEVVELKKKNHPFPNIARLPNCTVTAPSRTDHAFDFAFFFDFLLPSQFREGLHKNSISIVSSHRLPTTNRHLSPRF